MNLALLRGVVLALLLGVAWNATADEPLKICGGIASMSCAATEYCDFPNNHCGATDQTGFCMHKPEVCTREYMPVCGCDGKTYGNDCERRAAGVSKQADGQCTG